MSEELHELRQTIEAGNSQQALALIDEMDEWSRDAKINKIVSYMRVLLTHRIKQDAEMRTTPDWRTAIYVALDSIDRTNRRHTTGGAYLDEESLAHALAEAYPTALAWAAREAFDGVYSEFEIGDRVKRMTILAHALNQILGSAEDMPEDFLDSAKDIQEMAEDLRER